MWTCQHCATKVDPAFDVCWNCGASAEGVQDPTFVPADAAGPIADPIADGEPSLGVSERWDAPSPDLIACYQALTLMEAKFLSDQLNERGIPAICDAQDLQDALGTWQGNPKVYVRQDDLERAREWLATYDEHRKSGKSVADL